MKLVDLFFGFLSNWLLTRPQRAHNARSLLPGLYVHSPIMELVGFNNEGKIDGLIPSIRNRAMLVKLSLFLYTYAVKTYSKCTLT